MILSCILLAVSVSIDALSLGVTYGIKNAKVTKASNIIIFTIALISTSIAIIAGHYISILFSPNVAKILGSVLLIILGIYTIYKSFNENTTTDFDFDKSNSIDRKEAVLLALAVSVDASCVGLSCGMMGINSFIYPVLVAFFHMFFIDCGNLVARNVIKRFSNKLNKKLLSILSGVILIIIGLIRLIH